MQNIPSSKKWVKTAVIYQILLDRFAGFTDTNGWDSPIFLGGTFQGVKDNLPYLKELGVDAVWLSPHYQCSAYHGYHVTNYFQTDPHFGSVDAFQDLVETMHSTDIRVIIDFVPNHCSRDHPFFREATADRSSPYTKWFYFTKWPNDYLSFLSIREIPKWNLEYPPVRKHITDAMRFWLSMGVDGVRLDHVIGPSHQFWRYFTEKIGKYFPEKVLLGEAWMMGIRYHELQTVLMRHKYWRWLRRNGDDGLLGEYIGLLDGVLDFGVQHWFRQYFTTTGVDVAGFRWQIEKHFHRFPDDYLMPVFLDNHDMDRFLFHCGGDKACLKVAARELFRLPQPVIIYYGTESGMSQSRSMWTLKAHGDLMARMPMNWDDIDTEVYRFFQDLITQRHQNGR